MKKLAFNLVLVGFSLTLALVAGEILVRVAAPQLTYRFPQGLFVADDALAYRLAPGFTGELDTPEYETKVLVTAQGLRDDRVYGPKTDRELRILMLGDSFTMGVGVELSDTFVERLEEVLDRSIVDRDVEIVNAGVAGYSTRQELAFLEHYGKAFEPDAVLLGFFIGNDFTENAGKPLHVRDGYLVDDKGHGGMLPYKLRRFVSLNSQLYHFVWPIQRRLRGYGAVEEQATAQDIAAIFTADDAVAAPSFEPTREAIDALAAYCKRENLPLAVVLIPDHTQVIAGAWDQLVGQTGNPASAYDPEAPNRRLRTALAADGVPVLDLLPAFRAADDPERLYLPIDKHWTVAGHEIAVAAAAPFLEGMVDSTVLMARADAHGVAERNH